MSEVPVAEEDLITHLCFGFGAQGTEEVLSFEQKDAKYLPTIREGSTKNIAAYFVEPPPLELLEDLKQRLGAFKVSVDSEEERDWIEEWKKGFEPFQLAGPFWVVPSWCEIPKVAERPIFVDPGMAFGTGTHATTQLAADFIFEHLKGSPKVERVFEAGTGTGILAILAKQMGVCNVVCNDIDPESYRVARENFEVNKVIDIEFTEKDVSQIEGHFDLVIANIIDGILTEIKGDLLRLTRPGGVLILTGVLDERHEIFERNFSDQGLTLLERRLKNDWFGYKYNYAPILD